MGWAVGFDSRWERDIGYGVPAVCDRPRCGTAIDRGLGYVCGGHPYGGERGCGLFFCEQHLSGWRKDGDSYDVRVCGRCDKSRAPYDPTPDTAEWIDWKLTDESWGPWRAEHPDEVAAMRQAAAAATAAGEGQDRS
jgi:hypothetical protein